MDVDVVVVINGAIRAPGAIRPLVGVFSAPKDRVATKEEILGVMRGGDTGVVTKEERGIGDTLQNFANLLDLVNFTDGAGDNN